MSDRDAAVAALRLRFPAPKHRVSLTAYEAGVTFVGTSRAGLVVVLRGRCLYRVGGVTRELAPAKEPVHLPAGDFELHVLEDVELVRIWDLWALMGHES